MDQEFFRTAFLFLFIAIYFAILAYYAHLILVSSLLGLKLAFHHLNTRKKRASNRAKTASKASLSSQIKHLYQNSLFFNDALAVLSIFFCFGIITILPIDGQIRWSLVPFIACIAPFLLGFYRCTGVGIQSGIIGTTAGLFLLGTINPSYSNPIWTTNITWLPPIFLLFPFFLMITVVSNLSGFLGGFSGQGQVKDSKIAMIFDIRMCEEGQALNQLIEKAHDTVENFTKELKTDKKSFQKWRPDLTAAQLYPFGHGNANQNVILDFQQKYRWRLSYRPQNEARHWLLKRTVDFDANKLLDYISNVFRHQTIDLVIKNNRKSEEECAGNFILAIMVYMETPSIIWVDHDIQIFSEKLFASTQMALDSDRKGNMNYPWEVLNSNLFDIRYWRDRIALEQTVKKTSGSENSDKYILNSHLVEQNSCLAKRIDEFAGITTFFDRWRGKTTVLFSFLLGEVGLGVLVSWIYDAFF